MVSLLSNAYYQMPTVCGVAVVLYRFYYNTHGISVELWNTVFVRGPTKFSVFSSWSKNWRLQYSMVEPYCRACTTLQCSLLFLAEEFKFRLIIHSSVSQLVVQYCRYVYHMTVRPIRWLHISSKEWYGAAFNSVALNDGSHAASNSSSISVFSYYCMRTAL